MSRRVFFVAILATVCVGAVLLYNSELSLPRRDNFLEVFQAAVEWNRESFKLFVQNNEALIEAHPDAVVGFYGYLKPQSDPSYDKDTYFVVSCPPFILCGREDLIQALEVGLTDQELYRSGSSQKEESELQKRISCERFSETVFREERANGR